MATEQEITKAREELSIAVAPIKKTLHKKRPSIQAVLDALSTGVTPDKATLEAADVEALAITSAIRLNISGALDSVRALGEVEKKESKDRSCVTPSCVAATATGVGIFAGIATAVACCIGVCEPTTATTTGAAVGTATKTTVAGYLAGTKGSATVGGLISGAAL